MFHLNDIKVTLDSNYINFILDILSDKKKSLKEKKLSFFDFTAKDERSKEYQRIKSLVKKLKKMHKQIKPIYFSEEDKIYIINLLYDTMEKISKKYRKKNLTTLDFEYELQTVEYILNQFDVDTTSEKLEKETKEKLKTLKITLNPIKWGKYTLIINQAMKKFSDIYNFETPMEYKEQNYISLLAYTVLFEEARLNKLLADDFEELLVGFEGDTIFHKLIKPVGNTFFDFQAYNRMYTYYINYRAKRKRPIISMMASMQSMENSISEKEIEEFEKEYSNNLMFGDSI
jgi:hypothetical protein